MSLFGAFNTAFTSAASTIAKAGGSFTQLVSGAAKFAGKSFSPKQIKSLYRKHKASRQYKRAKENIPYVDHKALVPTRSRINAPDLQAKQYRYLFDMKVFDSEGVFVTEKKVSLLSDTRLTPNEAEEKVLGNIYLPYSTTHYEESHLVDLTFEAEIEARSLF